MSRLSSSRAAHTKTCSSGKGARLRAPGWAGAIDAQRGQPVRLPRRMSMGRIICKKVIQEG